MKNMRGKYRYVRWVWLAMVGATIIALPAEVNDLKNMVSQNHKLAMLIPVLVIVGLAWNGMLLKLWWNSRPKTRESLR